MGFISIWLEDKNILFYRGLLIKTKQLEVYL